MRRRWLVLPAAALAGWVGLGAATAFAAGGPSVTSGWWNEAAAGPLAAPTITPADQLQVSYGGSGYTELRGPLAFSAVRISVPAGTPSEDVVVLHLAIPSGGTVGSPAVSACPTTSTWKAGADQAPTAAPGYSCAGGHQVAGTVSGSSEGWSVPVAWASKGALQFALGPTAGTTAPFSVTYDQPTAASVSLRSPAPPSTVTSVPAAGGGQTPPSVTGSAGLDGPAGPSASAAFAGAFPATEAGPAPAAPPALGALDNPPAGASSQPATAGPASEGAPAAVGPGGAEPVSAPTRIPHVLAVILLLGVGVAVFGLAGQPDRAPQLLGPFANRLRDRPAPRGVEDRAAPAHMGGGARLRAHRQARLARRAAGLAEDGFPAAVAGAGPGSLPDGPVRGIGRFARPRSAPPRRL